MKFFIQTIFCIIFIIEPVSSQFQECSSPTSSNLYDVTFIDLNIGVAVGDSGTIIRTIDGGLNWTIVMSDDTISFKKVKFFNSKFGISIGTGIFITSNAGASWTKIDNSNFEYFDIEILNDSTCIVSGLPNKIIKSSNYGVDWEIIVPESFDYEVRNMSFIDENIGFATHWAGSVINSTLKTLDGGRTWTEINDESGGHITLLEDISFISEDIGFRGGWYDSHIMKTQNSSQSWSDVNLADSIKPQGYGIFDFHIEKSLPNAFYACGWHGKVFKSTDQGTSWNRLTTGAGLTTLFGIYFIDENNGWVVGEDGKILKTKTGGVITGIDQISSDYNVHLSPNPVTNSITIQNPETLEIKQIQIFNVGGALVKSVDEQNITINISDIPIGVYFVKIITNKGIFNQKIIKK